MNAPQTIVPHGASLASAMASAAHTFASATPAPLSARILAGCFDGLPEHYSDAEWRREAQAAHDCQDESPLLRMVAEGRLWDAHSEWQSLGALKGIDRQFVGIEEGPLAHEFLKLGRAA